ncbi:MAG: hypothetical protein K2K94_09300 [Muribaculaceae bacterium]|nr:hypothetical protein [Muribaculaceae bacterium]
MKTSTAAMNRLYKLLIPLSMLALAACSDDDSIDDASTSKGTVTVNITISSETEFETVTGSSTDDDSQATITDLRWLVTDTDGNVIDHPYCRLDQRLSTLSIEGLNSGNYNLIFAASLSDSPHASFSDPRNLSDPWVINNSDNSPIEGLYCYKNVPFTVGAKDKTMNVILEPSVARVNIDLTMPNPSLWRHIKHVRLTFNDEIPSTLNVDGTFGGSQSVTAYEVCDPSGVLTFTTFPSDKPLSGYVDIESSRDDGDNFVQRYEFSGLRLERGKTAHITLDYSHPDKESGLLYVAADELWRFEPSTMFMASESREIFYNNSIRSFYAEKPLQVWITPEGKLGVKFYSPIPIKDVSVTGCFNNLTTETVNLAYFEEVKPFMEAYFTLPVQGHDCVYQDATGRQVNIPAQPYIKPENLSVSIECDDPFMQKIATIDSHWYIRFSSFQADSGHAYWRHMDPLLCRHGVALALNMAFMFASPEFNEELQKYEGILYDNDHNPIDLDKLRAAIRNHGGLCLGHVDGVGGLGGGQTYGLADFCYTGVYHDSTIDNTEPHNYPRQAMFHEYGHCLGYSHDSNMTYGDCWTVICANVFVEMGRAGKLPVSNSTDVTGLPME